MDNYRQNRSGCGQRQSQQNCQQTRPNNVRPAQPSKPSCGCGQNLMFQAVDVLPAAMGYVPCTKFGQTFDLCRALELGTIFPELHKPFCGKGGGGCK